MDRVLAILALLVVAPTAVLLIVALLRGYTVHVALDRRKPGEHEADPP